MSFMGNLLIGILAKGKGEDNLPSKMKSYALALVFGTADGRCNTATPAVGATVLAI